MVFFSSVFFVFPRSPQLAIHYEVNFFFVDVSAIINIFLEFQPNVTRLDFLSARLWLVRSLSAVTAATLPQPLLLLLLLMLH